ncbi:MAG: UbiX family flavin prenyltransferase [Anaerolineae bacterium]|nr:UbiX family flavin prenyltransferase [Anaerolineae bacterium]
MNKSIIVAITGASGSIYGIRALEIMHTLRCRSHLVVSAAARTIIEQETGRVIDEVSELASFVYDPADIGAPIASGSFPTGGMLVAPCSIKTLSAIANSYTVDLIARAADVCLKEGRPLALMVRESPLHVGHLRLMTRAAEAGAVICPPIPTFYGHPQTIDDVIDASVGRALARLGIENDAYPKWGLGVGG